MNPLKAACIQLLCLFYGGNSPVETVEEFTVDIVKESRMKKELSKSRRAMKWC